MSNNINSYIWKDARISPNRKEKQVETKLITMDEDQLQNCYTHAKEMLYNNDSKNPGRMIVINDLVNQRQKCNAELCLRWFLDLKNDKGEFIYSTKEGLMSELQSWKEAFNANEKTCLKEFIQIPAEYGNVKVSMLEEACRDALGGFDHSKISFTFIYNLGLYLTQEERREIDNDLQAAGLNPDDYTLQAKIDNHVKVPLSITGAEIKINPRGLTLAEFKNMINMKHYKGYKMCKYSNLSTDQLHTLVSKVLYALEERTRWQAKKWQEIMSQIEEVANYQNFKLS